MKGDGLGGGGARASDVLSGHSISRVCRFATKRLALLATAGASWLVHANRHQPEGGPKRVVVVVGLDWIGLDWIG